MNISKNKVCNALIVAGLVALAAGAGLREFPIFNGKLTSAMNANNFAITNAPDPVAEGDLATKRYVDATGGMTPAQVGTISTNTVDAKVAPWAMKEQTQPLTAETDPTVPSWAKNPNPPVTVESDPKFTEWIGTNTYVKSESDPTVPAWAKQPNPPASGVTDVKTNGVSVVSGGVANVIESDPTVPAWAKSPTPPATGVTDVKVDGTSVVASGVANVSLSGKQDALSIITRHDGWVSDISRVEHGSYRVISAGEPVFRTGGGQEWSTDRGWFFTLTYFDDDEQVIKTREFGGQGSNTYVYKNGTWDRYGHGQNDDYIKYHWGNEWIYFRKNYEDASPVSSNVDATPSSTSTNKLVTSKGVADALANIPRGTDTNAVSGIITNHVTSGYLCTVETAQAMTNDESIVRQLPEHIIGTKKYSIYAARSEVADHATGSDSAISANKIYSIVDLISLEYDYTIRKWISKPDVGDAVPLAYESNTLYGYGITDAYTKTQTDALTNGFVTASVTNAVAAEVRTKADKSTTLSGYGITDAISTSGGNMTSGAVISFSGAGAGSGIELGSSFITGSGATIAVGNLEASNALNINGTSVLMLSTNAAEAVVGDHLYYASTNLADNVELRLFSGEWVNAEYDGVGTAAVVLDLTGVPTDKVTDTLMVLNCSATGTLSVATSDANACRVVYKKDAKPHELKAGLNLLTFSRYRMANGTNYVLVTNNELE